MHRSVLQTSKEPEAAYRQYLEFHEKRESYLFYYEHLESYTDLNMISIEAFKTTSVLKWKVHSLNSADLVQGANAQLYLLIAIYELQLALKGFISNKKIMWDTFHNMLTA